MNYQDKFLLPDKSFWMALDREQRKALVSKYTILCPPILFTEIARHGLSQRNPWLNLENIFTVPRWSERAKIELITGKSTEPIPFTGANAMKSICESSEEERLALEETASKTIDTLIDSENYIKNLVPIIDPWKEKILSLVKNTDNLSEKEWVDRLKEVSREFQPYYPKIGHTLERVDIGDCSREWIKSVKASLEALCNRFETDSLANAYQVATNLFDHDRNDRGAALKILQRLCFLFRSMLTHNEHTQVFNRFVKEHMPPISKFSPYALGAMVWRLTIHLYLRENPENAAPIGALRDAQYLLYTCYANVSFVSSDKWHRKFMNEVPLFKGGCENFTFVDNTTKATIQEGFSKLL